MPFPAPGKAVPAVHPTSMLLKRDFSNIMDVAKQSTPVVGDPRTGGISWLDVAELRQ